MIETKLPKVDIEGLETRARARLARLPVRTFRPTMITDTHIRNLSDQATFEATHVRDLYALEGEQFIRQVFRTLLGREADSPALQHYFEQMLSGESKAQVLARISLSSECRAFKPKLDGLLVVRVQYFLRRIPIVARLASVLWRVATLPQAERYQRAKALQAYQLLLDENSQLQKVAKNLNQAVEQLAGAHSRSLQLENKFIEQEHQFAEQLISLREHFDSLDKKLERRIDEKADRADLLKVRAVLEEQVRLKLDNADFVKVRKILESQINAKLGKETLANLATRTLLEEHTSQLQRELNRMTRSKASSSVTNDGSEKSESKIVQSGKFDSFYVAFEDKFRGDEAAVTNSFDDYLRIVDELPSGAECLDIGCGRGEWMQLLTEKGFSPLGIDLNQTMVEECRDKGLDVSLADLTSYLSEIPENSFDLITAFHVVEHLEFETLLFLFDESLRVLRPEGRILFETPNPSNLLVGSRNFYLDPTHRNPLPDDMLKFVAEQRGYRNVEVLPLHPVKEFDAQNDLSEVELDVVSRLYGPQDYAVTATK